MKQGNENEVVAPSPIGPNKPRIQAWVDALMSGEFTQTTGQLRKGDRYCCLGVACELYRRDTNDGYWDSCTFLNHDDYLPPAVVSHFGLPSDVPRTKQGSLTAFNDEDGKTFPEIADIIEAEWLK